MQIINQIKSLLEKGFTKEAEELINYYKASAIKNKNIEIYSLEANLHLLNGNYYEGYKAIQIGLEKEPQNCDLLVNFAQFHELKGGWHQAQIYYQTALKICNNQDMFLQISSLFEGLNERKNLRNQFIEQYKDEPLVSVIIPTYNMKYYLQETLESILFQDYPNIEIIISDDGSSDGTEELINQYCNDSRVKYFKNENNIGAKRNGRKLLYELSQGYYVLGINHDDYLIKSDYISRAVSFLEQNQDVSFVFANIKILYMETSKMEISNLNLPLISNGLEYFANYESSKNFPHITSVLTTIYRRDDAVQLGILKEETESQDLFIYMKLMLKGNVGFFSEYVGVYRSHKQSLSHNMPEADDLNTIKELEKLYEYASSLGIDDKKLHMWLQQRVYTYVEWRFIAGWNKNRLHSLELLIGIAKKYPVVFQTITDRLRWENI